ncbi:MAG: hypothetical protein KAS75_04815 [Planctomycetes bacterium]|nr:hypothetical protein [Planctomycetota bacterium]
MCPNHKKSIDWVRAIVHFVCGAILGVFIGLSAMPPVAMENSVYFALVILTCALVCGFIAAILGERFWQSL